MGSFSKKWKIENLSILWAILLPLDICYRKNVICHDVLHKKANVLVIFFLIQIAHRFANHFKYFQIKCKITNISILCAILSPLDIGYRKNVICHDIVHGKANILVIFILFHFYIHLLLDLRKPFQLFYLKWKIQNIWTFCTHSRLLKKYYIPLQCARKG